MYIRNRFLGKWGSWKCILGWFRERSKYGSLSHIFYGFYSKKRFKMHQGCVIFDAKLNGIIYFYLSAKGERYRRFITFLVDSIVLNPFIWAHDSMVKEVFCLGIFQNIQLVLKSDIIVDFSKIHSVIKCFGWKDFLCVTPVC